MRTGTLWGTKPSSAMLTVNGPFAGTLSRHGVTQLAPAALAWAPGGSDSTASPVGAAEPPPMSKLGIHEVLQAASIKPHAVTAMTRLISLSPKYRPPEPGAAGETIRAAPNGRKRRTPALRAKRTIATSFADIADMGDPFAALGTIQPNAPHLRWNRLGAGVPLSSAIIEN